MIQIPSVLYTAEQVRELDRIVIEEHGVPAYTLMQRAGAGVFREICGLCVEQGSVLIVCGPGNNGGDGLVAASLCLEADIRVTTVLLGELASLSGAAREAADAYIARGGELKGWNESLLTKAEIIVDAIFGTGLDRAISGEFARIIEQINASQIPVISADIPSGLHADTGDVLGVCVRAKTTVSFIGLKQGLFTGMGPEYVGQIIFDKLDVPEAAYKLEPSAQLIRGDTIDELLAPRHRSAHKGEHGHVLIIGGFTGMQGAVRMAGEAALRSGAGLVTVATHPDNQVAIAVGCPELMVHPVTEPAGLLPLAERADVVVVGPGLGQAAWGEKMLAAVLKMQIPRVIDADGLNLLVRQNLEKPLADTIITPHAGEASRLLRTDSRDVQSDRFKAANLLVERWADVAVLKGAGTLVAGRGHTINVCDRGNPGMATAGMGDLLTGVIAALVGQGLDMFTAAAMGVYIHASAGDDVAVKGERGLKATDLLPFIRRRVNPLSKNRVIYEPA